MPEFDESDARLCLGLSARMLVFVEGKWDYKQSAVLAEGAQRRAPNLTLNPLDHRHVPIADKHPDLKSEPHQPGMFREQLAYCTVHQDTRCGKEKVGDRDDYRRSPEHPLKIVCRAPAERRQ
jgi:hypothetical protein